MSSRVLYVLSLDATRFRFRPYNSSFENLNVGQLEDYRLFVSVVDSGSIVAASESLGVAKSAVSRRLALLEDRYDVRLIKRDTRNWEVTSAGRELYQRARAMVADADEIDSDFKHLSQSHRGPLSISIAREFGLSYLQPVLFDFMQNNPEIEITIDFDDRITDLDSENYDLAIRITGVHHSGLVVERIGGSNFGLYASPKYCELHGKPETVDDLKQHALLYYGSARRAQWSFARDKETYSLDFKPALNSNCGPFLLASAENGCGIAQLPDFIVSEAISQKKLISLLPNYSIAEFGIFVVYSENRRITNRMRALIDALTAACTDLNN